MWTHEIVSHKSLCLSSSWCYSCFAFFTFHLFVIDGMVLFSYYCSLSLWEDEEDSWWPGLFCSLFSFFMWNPPSFWKTQILESCCSQVFLPFTNIQSLSFSFRQYSSLSFQPPFLFQAIPVLILSAKLVHKSPHSIYTHFPSIPPLTFQIPSKCSHVMIHNTWILARIYTNKP